MLVLSLFVRKCIFCSKENFFVTFCKKISFAGLEYENAQLYSLIHKITGLDLR